jgi:hypothetical protein
MSGCRGCSARPQASTRAIGLTGIHLCWFDRWLKGIDNDVSLSKPCAWMRSFQASTSSAVLFHLFLLHFYPAGKNVGEKIVTHPNS